MVRIVLRIKKGGKDYINYLRILLPIEQIKAQKGIKPKDVKIERADVKNLLIVTKASIRYIGELLKNE